MSFPAFLTERIKLKRLFDLFLSSAGIIFFFPLGLVFALLVKAEDGGPIFYTQDRWGMSGRKFKAYKFRTMVPGAELHWGLKPAAENDERVTRIGRFLRATAMDELPQLLNIWKGDMSFVGPRALAAEEIDPGIPGFSERHQIQPGLTGPAQVYSRRDVSIHEKFRYDLDYVHRHPFLEDLKLLLLSVWITLRGKWESRQKKI